MQDFHIKGKNSRNRLGNYFEDLLLKFDEIIKIAVEQKCEAIIDGGDLLETKKPSYKVLDQLADRIEEAKIPMYSLFGNHAMHCGHLENSKNTGLAHLQNRSKYFKYLTELNGEDWNIKGFDYYYDIENFIKDQGISIIERLGKGCKSPQWNVAIVHALVTPTKFFDTVSHVTLDQIKTNADLVLCAHYHKPFKKVVKNTTYLNIGCAGRDNIDEANIEPSVLILDTSERKYEIIKLSSAKKGKDIFDLSKYDELKANKKDIKQFIESLRDVNLQSMDLGRQIVKIGKEQDIDQNVIDYMLETMENVNE